MSDLPESAAELSWLRGNRAAYTAILSACLRALDYDASDPALLAARLAAEREDAVAALRRVCEEHGDNDWPDDLHLGDVVEKHLTNYLEEE